MDLKAIKIGVLGGGVSSEREISLISAQQAYQILERNNLKPVFIDITASERNEVKALIRSYSIDAAFIALHGEFGEDGKCQQILEELRIPYTGSGPAASFLSLDKSLSKKVFVKNGITTPRFSVYSRLKDIPEDIEFPIVVKPHFSGSSLGVSIVRRESELKEAVRKAFSYNSKVIIEEYIAGRELTVGILAESPLAVVEIIPRKGHYDFEAKYDDGGASLMAPARLEERVYRSVQEIGLRAHQALGCRHFSRIDLRLSPENKPYVLEVNSIPGLTAHSLLPLSARACGITFGKLILQMVELALSNYIRV